MFVSSFCVECEPGRLRLRVFPSYNFQGLFGNAFVGCKTFNIGQMISVRHD